MKRASYRLAYADAESVTDIAMDAGYDRLWSFDPDIEKIGCVASGLLEIYFQ